MQHLILRLAWVYGRRGRNFLVTMLWLARTRPELRVVDDQVGALTASGVVESATAMLCYGLLRGHGPEGTYHLPAGGETPWHGFAEAIFDRAPPHLVPARPRVVAIPTAEYGTPARRPAWSVPDGGALEAAMGLHPPRCHDPGLPTPALSGCPLPPSDTRLCRLSPRVPKLAVPLRRRLTPRPTSVIQAV